MGKFREELGFTLICIIIYFAGVIIANRIADISGIPDLANAVFEILFAGMVLLILKKKKLLTYYGIRSLKELNFKKLLYFIPMLLIASVSLWFGVSIHYPTPQLIFILIAMAGVGFSEEILFRSFLMRAIMNKNKTAAIVISSGIFGLFHIANLFGGADVFLTILQIIYAVALGFMFAVFFYKTGNIIPCILCHSLTNMASTFMPENLSMSQQVVMCLAYIVLSAYYGGRLSVYTIQKEL